MKKPIRIIVSIFMTAVMCVSLCSCNVFKAMRENAEKAAAVEILETPDEEKALEIFNTLTVSCAEKASELKENVSYKTGNPEVLKGEEKAGLLASAAKQIKNFIMESKPGNTSEVITPDDTRLMKMLDSADVLNFVLERNYQSEKVTDENGNHILDENGKNVTETHVGDNILKLTMNYYNTESLASATDTDGEEMTRIVSADDSTIESVFGEAADKDAVLSEFDSLKDYIKVNGYEISYTDCKVYSEINIYEDLVSFVRFQKNMKVTADVTCVGVLAEYGELTVTFPLTKTVEYTFAYPADE